ncbi:superfamily II DNA/RNA helicase [Fontibacillus phaseoli]|uniref:Superfamily II DNA/RNA helicase n=1 Tax=Fontibacillus phaseoli TaxID=1416533 RepID=A0A369BGZ4_9BACL|nr:DEAD/DEAH box helicase [Fontibacillus phaseoli]RCX19747.1 superfamily II DNA/RNA helicase [Fontibacillus phaseoli]
MTTTNSFTGLGLDDTLAAKLADYGIMEPSPVQAECIPAALAGRDVLAQSQTGTGKTLAYLLPLLQNIDADGKNLQGLILAPTQELAMQIVREAEKYGEARGIRVQALIGGAAIKRQLERLKLHPQLIVGTPGRIREILALRKLKLHTVRTVVVDEVDQMFQLGGTADLEHILRGTLRERQLLFLSATVNPEIRTLAGREMKEALEIGIEPEHRTSKSVEHLYFISERDKIDILRRIIRHYNPARSIVFINNTADIGEVEAKMNFVGLSAGALYGDADKIVRSVTLRKFREGKIRVLVATDVAARGLDIEELSLVVNLDPPIDSEHYVHRVGRTGRMGRKGLAVSIISPKEEFIMRKFSRELGIGIALRDLYGGEVIDPQAPSSGRGSGQGRQSGPGQGRAQGRGYEQEPERSSGRSAGGTRREGTGNAKPGPASSGRGSGAGAGAAQAPAVREAGRQARNGSGAGSAGTRNAAPGGARKNNSKQDRKNKGAPKWLKDKQSRD